MPLFDKLIRCPFCDTRFPARTNYVNKIHEEKSSHQVAVEKAMSLARQDIPEKPEIPSLEVRKLRAKLILEEALETIHALGFACAYSDLSELGVGIKLAEKDAPNLQEIIDGCCDLRVVTTGTLSACGIKDVVPQEMVDQNNLDKFMWTEQEVWDFMTIDKVKEGYKHFTTFIDNEQFRTVLRPDGKYLKPPSHTKPMLDREIKRQEGL